jgi:hypothetical protein
MMALTEDFTANSVTARDAKISAVEAEADSVVAVEETDTNRNQNNSDITSELFFCSSLTIL